MGQFLIAAAAVIAVPIHHDPRVELASPDIRVADVVDLRGLNAGGREAIGRRIVARIPSGRRSITLSHAALASLVRRSVPALRPLPGDGEKRFELAAELGSSNSSCVTVVRAVGAGEAIGSGDLAEATCDSVSRPDLIFHRRSHTVRAVGAMTAGTPLGRLVPPPPPAVEAGRKLTLIAQVGPARIERDVIALQPGRHGQRLFVIDGDGNVEALALAAEARKLAQ